MEYVSPHFYKENKARNILRLAERYKVICDYNSRPWQSLQILAAKYDCSYMQIRNIIQKRNTIIKQYKQSAKCVGVNKEPLSSSSSSSLADEASMKREAKIVFMGKVMYEYLQRVVYFNYIIDEEKARQKFKQIKECINIEHFELNSKWLEHFKEKYCVKDFSMESLRDCVKLTDPKRPHLGAADMIEFVSRQEMKARRAAKKRLGCKGSYAQVVGHTANISCRKSGHVDGHNYGKSEDRIKNPKALTKSQDGHITYHDQVIQELTKPKPLHPNMAMYTQTLQKSRKSDFVLLRDINSSEEALKHLKALEEYAMLKDNYRAIGLLSQLEKLFSDEEMR